MLEAGLVKYKATDYDDIDIMMRKICKFYKLTLKKLHMDFKKKHKMTPDTWIKKVVEKYK